MNDSTPENDEPTSFVEKTKYLYGKHKGKILAAGTALGGMALAVAVVVSKTAMEQNASDDGEDAEDSGSVAESASADERRNGPVRHSVVGHKRTLADGRIISVAPYERGGSSDDEDEDESPGEAAA
ncbi:hypothetical protein [Streptomyces nigra]|uniref:hypothetical protein n=1 Tax=Streptomyces nigra TaxID=1827580 RepID=UPI000F4D5435|nr:hypothetical protein [Streptomyces nigra]